MLSCAMAAFRVLCLVIALLPPAAAAAQQRAPSPEGPPAPAARLGEATLDDTLDVAGDSVTGEQVETRMAVDVAINGRGPFRFVVDSGADRTVIGERLALTLGLPAGQAVTLHSMAGTSRRQTALIARLAVGGSMVTDIAAPLLPERHLGARGLLGIDALRGQRLMLDFERQAITIEDTRRPVTASADEIVVTARPRGGQLILTQARAGGVRIRAVIDTGSQLTIGNIALRDALFRRRRPPPVTETTLVSVTGEAMVVPMAIVPELRIGGIVMSNVPVAFADLPPFALFGLAGTPAMMLGTDLMGSFRRVSLDFGAKKVRFQLRRCRASGLVVGSRPFRLRDDAPGSACR